MDDEFQGSKEDPNFGVAAFGISGLCGDGILFARTGHAYKRGFADRDRILLLGCDYACTNDVVEFAYAVVCLWPGHDSIRSREITISLHA